MTNAIIAYGGPILFMIVGIIATAIVRRANRHSPERTSPPPGE